MRCIAVVGGTGFLGRHVVGALRADGAEVRVLSRRTGVDGRGLDPEAIRGCEAVVNLAGIKREEGDQTFESVHVDLPARIVEAMKEAHIRRLIHISVVVARPAPDMPYHDTKWKGEMVVQSSGLEWTILRPGVIYGAGDDLLSHLAIMINASPLFPIVNDGGAPMMPVRAADVAAGVVGALRNGATAGKTYDLVGPERLTLRDVVARVAQALGRRVWFVPTPAAVMKLPVGIMEATMKHPLSTRAQLSMLVGGLAGDPAPARADLGVEPTPFTPEFVAPLLESGGLRLKKEIGAGPAAGLYALAVILLAFAFRGPLDPWRGMTLAMGTLLAGSLLFRAVRRRMSPTVGRVALGLAAGGILYGLTRLGVSLLTQFWPAWEHHARTLSAWKSGYSTPFLAATLVMIVVAEEAVWRGVVARFAIERLGQLPGLVLGAAFYTAAHGVTMNPLLLAAAFGCGLYWGLLYIVTDDLTAPLVSHLVWDVLVMFLFPVV